MVGLVVGTLARWAFESVSMLTAIADRSFDFAQDDKLDMQCAIGLVISDQGSVIRTRHAFFGKKVPAGRMMVGLVVGTLARWAFESVSMLMASAGKILRLRSG